MAIDEETGPTASAGSSPTGRIERIFVRIGLVAAVLLLLAIGVAVDVALTSVGTPDTDPIGDDFVLVTPEGRELGQGDPHALRLVLKPGTVYEHLPDPRIGINSLGLRGPEVAPVPDRPRIVVVGGSAVFGPNRFSFVSDLARARPDLEFLNAGMIGYLSRQELALVVFELLDLAPSMIIAFDGWNDLYDRYWWRRYGHSDVPHRGVNVNFNFIEDRLIRYRRVEWEPGYALLETGRSIVRGSTLLSGLAALLGRDRPTPAPPVVDEAMLDEVVTDYVANMKKLHDIAVALGIRFLVVIQPEIGQFLDAAGVEEARTDWIERRGLDPDEWEGYFDAFPAGYLDFRIRAVGALAAEGIEVIDSSEKLLRGGAGFREFIDPVHLSREGHARVAQFLSYELPPPDEAP